jgi:hypothetical protein
MRKGYPEVHADIGELTQLGEEADGLGRPYLRLLRLFPTGSSAILHSYRLKPLREEHFDV